MKIHLVDGTYELFRMFFGAPERKAPDGQEVGAVRALVGSLLSLVRDDGATHIAVAFDTVIESFRNELFDGYKTGAGIDPDLYSQFPLAEEAVRALGMVCWSMVEFEADDALATGAALYKREPGVEQVLICSPDKDLGQCVEGQRVVLSDRRKKLLLDEEAVRTKMGVPPRLIPDLLALVGDTADGIPGVPRWGSKSAATVLSHYGSLEAIPADEGQWDLKVRGAAALAASLRERREDAALYKTLATLREDVPLAERSAEDLAWQGAHRGRLGAFLTRIGDEEAATRVPSWR